MVQRIMQRLPEGIDKDEYELTKWSTMILHVRVESLRNLTKGGVLDEVRRLRDESVDHTRGKIR